MGKLCLDKKPAAFEVHLVNMYLNTELIIHFDVTYAFIKGFRKCEDMLYSRKPASTLVCTSTTATGGKWQPWLEHATNAMSHVFSRE